MLKELKIMGKLDMSNIGAEAGDKAVIIQAVRTAMELNDELENRNRRAVISEVSVAIDYKVYHIQIRNRVI